MHGYTLGWPEMGTCLSFSKLMMTSMSSVRWPAALQQREHSRIRGPSWVNAFQNCGQAEEEERLHELWSPSRPQVTVFIWSLRQESKNFKRLDRYERGKCSLCYLSRVSCSVIAFWIALHRYPFTPALALIFQVGPTLNVKMSWKRKLENRTKPDCFL